MPGRFERDAFASEARDLARPAGACGPCTTSISAAISHRRVARASGRADTSPPSTWPCDNLQAFEHCTDLPTTHSYSSTHMTTLESQTATTFGQPSSLLFASDSQTPLEDTPTRTAERTGTLEDTFVSNGLLSQDSPSTLSEAGPSRIPEDGAFGGMCALLCGGRTFRMRQYSEVLRVWRVVIASRK